MSEDDLVKVVRLNVPGLCGELNLLTGVDICRKEREGQGRGFFQ